MLVLITCVTECKCGILVLIICVIECKSGMILLIKCDSECKSDMLVLITCDSECKSGMLVLVTCDSEHKHTRSTQGNMRTVQLLPYCGPFCTIKTTSRHYNTTLKLKILGILIYTYLKCYIFPTISLLKTVVNNHLKPNLSYKYHQS